MTTYYGPLGLRNCFSSLITFFLTIFAITLFLNKAHLRQEETPTPPPSSPPDVVLNVSKVEREEEAATHIFPPPLTLNGSKVARQEEGINTPYPPPPAALNGSSGEDNKCDLFSGRWVYDNSTHPLYSVLNCSFMHDEVACDKYGRKDRLYQNWRWQPHGCDIPRFNATKLLERLRGKRMVFVGDSLNRNQWVSMVCLVESSIRPEHKSMKFNGSLLSFKAKELNATIDFYWSPLLLESNGDDPIIHRTSDRIIRANAIEKHAKHWTNADIVVFNSYLWWKKPGIKLKILHGSFEDENKIFEEMELPRGLGVALKTWSEWLESHVDTNKTQLFFVSMSPTHVWADEWGKPKDENCYGETEPITKEGYRSRGSDYSLLRTVEAVVEGLRHKGIHVQILNISQLSEYRKDGHPSIYRRQYVPLTQGQLADPKSYSDCTHWCLPGVPDTWNELLYAYLTSR